MTINSVPVAGVYPTRFNKREAKVIETARNGLVPTPLADGKIFIGDAGGSTAAKTISGDISMTREGVVSISSGVIVNADVKSDAAIVHTKLSLTGSGLLKHIGSDDAYTTVGGNAAEVIAVVGAASGDKVVVGLLNDGSNNRTIVSAVAGTDTLTITFSGDPGNDAIISYMVARAL